VIVSYNFKINNLRFDFEGNDDWDKFTDSHILTLNNRGTLDSSNVEIIITPSDPKVGDEVNVTSIYKNDMDEPIVGLSVDVLMLNLKMMLRMLLQE